MQLAKLFRENNLTLAYGDKQYTIQHYEKRFKEIVDILKENKDKDDDYVFSLLQPLLENPENVMDGYLHYMYEYGFIKENGHFMYKGFELPEFTQSILENLYKAGMLELGIKSITKFFDKVIENPDKHVAKQLFGFLENGNMPLLENGNFLAYKIVDGNLKSIHPNPNGSHIQHVLNEEVSMPRENCDNNPERTCSTGLHFCSKEYLPHYGTNGQKILVVEVNPYDVTSIPVDYNLSKGRCCKYIPRNVLDNDQYIPENTILDSDLNNMSVVIKDENGNNILDLNILDILSKEDAEEFVNKILERRSICTSQHVYDNIDFDDEMNYDEEDYYEDEEYEEESNINDNSIYAKFYEDINKIITNVCAMPDKEIDYNDYLLIKDFLDRLSSFLEYNGMQTLNNIAKTANNILLDAVTIPKNKLENKEKFTNIFNGLVDTLSVTVI